MALISILSMSNEAVTKKMKTLSQMERKLLDFVDVALNVDTATEDTTTLTNDKDYAPENDSFEDILSDEDDDDTIADDDYFDDDYIDEDELQNGKAKREIREYDSYAEKELTNSIKNESKASEEKKNSMEKTSTEIVSIERSSEFGSKEKFITSSFRHSGERTKKPYGHRKHRKYRIGSSEKFFTGTHATTSTPIQVRQSRTKSTQQQNGEKKTWHHSQKFQQHTLSHKDTITKDEAVMRGYSRYIEDGSSSYESEKSLEEIPEPLSYNMIMVHFSADTSHYSRDRDPHYFGNGRMQIKSEVYKDWKPAHWTQGVGMSKYFHLHQGRVTVSTTGIYLIYAQIQYSNVQEVNGFSVFRNNEVVVQCITTSTHPDKHEIKSNTCGISTTILLQSNDTVCIKDLHHGRYVVLTPEKSYFGLVLLSPFK